MPNNKKPDPQDIQWDAPHPSDVTWDTPATPQPAPAMPAPAQQGGNIVPMWSHQQEPAPNAPLASTNYGVSETNQNAPAQPPLESSVPGQPDATDKALKRANDFIDQASEFLPEGNVKDVSTLAAKGALGAVQQFKQGSEQVAQAGGVQQGAQAIPTSQNAQVEQDASKENVAYSGVATIVGLGKMLMGVGALTVPEINAWNYGSAALAQSSPGVATQVNNFFSSKAEDDPNSPNFGKVIIPTGAAPIILDSNKPGQKAVLEFLDFLPQLVLGGMIAEGVSVDQANEIASKIKKGEVLTPQEDAIAAKGTQTYLSDPKNIITNETLGKIKPDLSDGKKVAVAPLIEQKQALEQRNVGLLESKGKLDSSFHDDVDKEVADNEKQIATLTQQIKTKANEKETTPGTAQGANTQADNRPGESQEGEGVGQQQLQGGVQGQQPGADTGTQPDTQETVASNEKPGIINAPTKQTSDALDVQEPSADGKGMGVGDTQPQGTTGKEEGSGNAKGAPKEEIKLESHPGFEAPDLKDYEGKDSDLFPEREWANNPDRVTMRDGNEVGTTFRQLAKQTQDGMKDVKDNAPDNTLITTHSKNGRMINALRKVGDDIDLDSDEGIKKVAKAYLAEPDIEKGEPQTTKLDNGKTVHVAMHGTTEDDLKDFNSGQSPVNLSKEGIKDSKDTAQAVEDKNISHIISSPTERAMKTSKIIQEHLNKQIAEQKSKEPVMSAEDFDKQGLNYGLQEDGTRMEPELNIKFKKPITNNQMRRINEVMDLPKGALSEDGKELTITNDSKTKTHDQFIADVAVLKNKLNEFKRVPTEINQRVRRLASEVEGGTEAATQPETGNKPAETEPANTNTVNTGSEGGQPEPVPGEPTGTTDAARPNQESEPVTQAAGFAGGAEPPQPPDVTREGVYDDTPDYNKSSSPVQDFLNDTRSAPKFERDIAQNVKQLNGINKANTLRAVKLMEMLPDKFKDPVLQENVYHHMEDPTLTLTADEMEFRDKYVVPVLNEIQGLYRKLEKIDPESAAAAMKDAVNYFPRLAKDKQGIIDRIINGTKYITGGGLLGKTASSLKSRIYKALTDNNGNRTLVTMKDGRVTALHGFDEDGNSVTQDLGGFKRSDKGLSTKELRDKQLNDDLGYDKKMGKLQAEKKNIQRFADDPKGQRRLDYIEKKINDLNAAKDKINEHYDGVQKVDDLNAERTDLRNSLITIKDKEQRQQVQARIADLRKQSEDLENQMPKYWVDKNGKFYSIGEATTKEIEEKSPTQYYHTPFANVMSSYLDLQRADTANTFIDHFKESPEFSKIGVPKGDKTVPGDWREVLPIQFKGYVFDPKTAANLDLLYRNGKADPLQSLTNINTFFRDTIVLGPGVKHWYNIADQWIKQGGLVTRLTNPVRTTKAMMKAFHDVSTQSPDYFKALENGAGLMYRETQDASNLLLKVALEQKNQTWFQKLSDKMGYANPETLFEALRSTSHKSAFYVNDMLVMQAINEEVAKGKPWSEAVKEVHKYLPDYQIPAQVLGSENLAKVLRNPNLLTFGSYHYNIMDSYANMANDLGRAMSNSGMSAADRGLAVDRVATAAFMHFAFYAGLTALYHAVGGDKDKKIGSSGGTKFMDDAIDFIKGNKNLRQFVQGYFMPAVGTQAAAELITNTKLSPYESGNIYTPTDVNNHPGEALKDIGKYLETKVAPQTSQLQSGKQTAGDFIQDQLLNTKIDRTDQEQKFMQLLHERDQINQKVHDLKKKGKYSEATQLQQQYNQDLNNAR
jgi:broad specificity phosphatase PhoE